MWRRDLAGTYCARLGTRELLHIVNTKTLLTLTGGLVAMALSLQAAVSISVVNSGFELPGTVKTEYWDATGAIVPGIIPGWTANGVGVEGPGGPVFGPGDSGVETDTTFGAWHGYLAGRDPSIFNTTSYILGAGNSNLTLTIAARGIYTDRGVGSSVLQLSLYYLSGTSRVQLGGSEFSDDLILC